jgi:adenylate kinase
VAVGVDVQIIVFLGAPGSGKGTQAKRLEEAHNFRHLSTGDMLRAAVKSGNSVGVAAKSYIDRGDLVPDDVIIDLLGIAIRKLPPESKVILDGFPRTVPQSDALDSQALTEVSRAVYFVIPQAELVLRLTGRRVCEKCGEPFHVMYLPPRVEGVCDRCSGKLIQRIDDAEEVVRRRLKIFEAQNGELLNYYRQRGRLEEIDAHRPVEVVQANLIKLLG